MPQSEPKEYVQYHRDSPRDASLETLARKLQAYAHAVLTDKEATALAQHLLVDFRVIER